MSDTPRSTPQDEIAKMVKWMRGTRFPEGGSAIAIGMFYTRLHEAADTLERLSTAQSETAARDAKIVCDLLDIGDQRLLASDGPVGGQLPDLSPDEWGKVYRACKRIAGKQ